MSSHDSSIMRKTQAASARLAQARSAGLLCPAAVQFQAGREAPAMRRRPDGATTMVLCGHAYYATEQHVVEVVDRGLASLNGCSVLAIDWAINGAVAS